MGKIAKLSARKNFLVANGRMAADISSPDDSLKRPMHMLLSRCFINKLLFSSGDVCLGSVLETFQEGSCFLFREKKEARRKRDLAFFLSGMVINVDSFF